MATYLINRTPSRVLQFKTPYEIVYGKIASFENLKVFSSLAFTINLTVTDKFQPRSILCVFLGYSNKQKGFILLDLDTKKIFFSRHVRFVENKFPFKDFVGFKQKKTNKSFNDVF